MPANFIGLVLLAGGFLAYDSWHAKREKKRWNNGICPKCGSKLKEQGSYYLKAGPGGYVDERWHSSKIWCERCGHQDTFTSFNPAPRRTMN